MGNSFDGFERSNTTPIPDVLFDELLSVLSGSELKVLLYIMRRTWGFKKDTDAIALSQFEKGIVTQDGRVLDRGCGLNRETICKALKSLEKGGYIESEKHFSSHGDKDITVYKIHFKGSRKNELPVVGKNDQGVVGLTDQGSRKNSKRVVGKSDLQETVIQETVKQQTERSMPAAPVPSISFSLEEETMLQWLNEEGIRCSKDLVVVKKQLAALIPHINTKEKLHKYCVFAKEEYRDRKNPRVALGNLADEQLFNAFLQAEENLRPFIAPPTEQATEIASGGQIEALAAEIQKEYPELQFGMGTDMHGNMCIGIFHGDRDNDYTPVYDEQDWLFFKAQKSFAACLEYGRLRYVMTIAG